MQKNNNLEFILSLFPTILIVLSTILAIFLTIKLGININIEDTNLLIFDIVFEETSRIIVIALGSIISLIGIILSTFMFKASKGLKEGKKGWAIFLIIVGIIMIITLQIPTIAIGITAIAPGMISLIKNKKS